MPAKPVPGRDVARREEEAGRFHTSLAHSRVTAPAHRTLPEVQRLAAGDEEWVQLMAQMGWGSAGRRWQPALGMARPKLPQVGGVGGWNRQVAEFELFA